MVNPLNPPSRIITFEPAPRTNIGIELGSSLTSFCRLDSEFISTKNVVFPPEPNQVFFLDYS